MVIMNESSILREHRVNKVKPSDQNNKKFLNVIKLIALVVEGYDLKKIKGCT